MLAETGIRIENSGLPSLTVITRHRSLKEHFCARGTTMRVETVQSDRYGYQAKRIRDRSRHVCDGTTIGSRPLSKFFCRATF